MKTIQIPRWFQVKNMTSEEIQIYLDSSDVILLGETMKAVFVRITSEHGSFEKWFPRSVVTLEDFRDPNPERTPRRDRKKEVNDVFGSEGMNRMITFLKSWGVNVDDVGSIVEAEMKIEDFGLMKKWKEENGA